MEFLKNPILVGGLLPMIAFGIYNTLFSDISKNFSLAEILFAIGTTAIFSALLFHFFGNESLEKIFFTLSWWKVVLVAFFWVSGMIGISLGFLWGGSVSLLIPLVNANSFISILLAIAFQGEKFSWNIFIGSFFILFGSIILLIKDN